MRTKFSIIIKHYETLKARDIKKAPDKVVKNKPLAQRQLQHHISIFIVSYTVERTF